MNMGIELRIARQYDSAVFLLEEAKQAYDHSANY